MEEWLTAARTDPELGHVARWTRVTVELDCPGAWTRRLLVHDGDVRLQDTGAVPVEGDVVRLRAAAPAWAELVDPDAAPRRHDLLSLVKQPDGVQVVDGWPALLRHLRVLTRLVDLAKGRTGEPTGQDVPGSGVEDVVGRYVRFTSRGVPQRVHFEEAGSGPVLLCLHTAGADARQYRHLLADPAVTGRFRVLAPDLPGHGRSLPPDGWWRTEHLLTTDDYVALVQDLCDALGVQRPLVLGCSMAGSLVLELARRSPERWRGVVGLSGALAVPGRFADWSLHPDLNAQQVVASWTASLMAPQSPESARREVWWTYAQGGPGVYRGDTYFYSCDLDLRATASTIDTARCPVVLLTGEYDHACTPADTAAAIAAVPGARGGTMPGLGHFPMAENYPLFREHLLPVLADLHPG